MAIKTQVIVAENSSLTIDDIRPFEQKILMALNKTIGKDDKKNLHCNINVDVAVASSIESQLQKIGKNILFGIASDTKIDDSLRRAFVFECLSIKDEKANHANRIVIILSSKGFVHGSDDAKSNNSNENEDAVSFDAVSPKYSLDKVILDESTVSQLSRAIALIRNQKLIFDTWGFREVDPNTKTILCFFGAPGTGKTMCAHAIAKELGKKIMIASYASIESKWVGEGPKNMRKIFKDATDQDAILFFDEADSFLSKRVNNAETGSDKHYNRMSNEMFQLLEEFDGVVIFATNLVSDFDKAFKSRILSLVEFTLPDAPTRAKLIETMIPSKLPLKEPLSASVIQLLANCSEGFSGREIRKALLTSLSDGALNRVSEFGINELLVGFEAVKQERSAIEETASKERNILADYIETNEQNLAILEVCQWALNQQSGYTDKAKETLYKVTKLLYTEMPDLSVSFKDKALGDAYEKILQAERANETIKYVCQLIVDSNMEENIRLYIFQTLSAHLGVEENKIEQYFQSLKILN